MKFVNRLSPKKYKLFQLSLMRCGDLKEIFPLWVTLGIFSDDVEFRSPIGGPLQKR